MFIKPVSVSDKWLKDNTVVRLSLPPVELKEQESVLTRGPAPSLPFVFEKGDKFDRIKLVIDSEVRMGSGKHGQFKSPLNAEESSDNEKNTQWLCVDEETENGKGVLFKTQEQAEAFKEYYKSLDNYFKLDKSKPFTPSNINYLLLSGNTLGFFKDELRASKQKHIVKGEYNLTQANSRGRLVSPDGSNWVIVILEKKVDSQTLFPNSNKIQMLLQQNSDAKKFGELVLSSEIKTSEPSEKKKSNPLLSCFPLFKAKHKTRVEEAPASADDLVEMKKVI